MNIETLTNDMYSAMKNGDKEKKAVLSSLISNIKKMAIDNRCTIYDELVDKAILKEMKTVQEQIDTCPDDRVELLEKYKEDLFILEEYAPKRLSKEEIIDILNSQYADVLAEKNVGKIMKAVMPELKGKADGKIIKEVVTEICKYLY